MSQREDVLVHVGDLLTGAGVHPDPPAGVPAAVRSRMQALEPSDLPAVTYYPELDDVEPAHRVHEGGVPKLNPRLPVKRKLDIVVEHTAKAGSGTTADQELDPLCSWTVKALVGGDWTGVAMGAQELKTEFTPDVADEELFMAATTIRVYYTSRAGDPDLAN